MKFYLTGGNEMKFLVITKPKGVPLPENYADLLKSAETWINSKIASGELESLYGMLPYRSIAIATYESHEKMWEDMVSYPLYPFLEFKLKPLYDWKTTFAKSIAMLSR